MTDNSPMEIEVPIWYHVNRMAYRRDSLPTDHPGSTYKYIKNVLGLFPEDYGCFSCIEGKTEELQKLSKEKLINKIIDLENELENKRMYDF